MNDKLSGVKMNKLIEDLNCELVTKCQNARRILVEIGSDAVPILIKALDNKEKWVRWEAIKALGQIADPAATGALINLLDNPEFDMRWMAAEGLIAIGRATIVPLLKTLVERSNSLLLYEGTHHVLHDIRRGDLDEILKPVMEALESSQATVTVPIEAAIALEKIRNK